MSRSHRLPAGAALLLVPALLAGCGPKPAAIRVNEAQMKVYGIGRTTSVSGAVVDEKDRPVPGHAIKWESSAPKVATVDEKTGSVKTRGAGKATLKARVEKLGLSAQVALEVVDVAVVSVLPPRTTLAGPAGSTSPLAFEVKDSKGARVDLPVVWSTSDPKVASVDARGLVTSVGEGKVTVKATVGDVDAAADVVVVFRSIDSLEATPLTIPLKVGETGKVTLVARDADGAPIPDIGVAWTTSDPAVATCTGGTVLGVGPGSATIRAVCGAKSAEVSVIVF